MSSRPNPSGRRIAQPATDVQQESPNTWQYLNQLVRDLELNFLDTQEVETNTFTIFTSVNNNVTVVQNQVSNVSSALVSTREVLENQLSIVSSQVTSNVSVLDARITSVALNAGFSALVLRNGAGALITQSSVVLRLQDSRDL